MKGWIKLHRSLKDWQWYDDKNATRLLIHLLITVNYEEKKWKGIVINAGSRIFSWDVLSKEIGLSPRQCRTAMEKLENSNEVVRYVTNKFQLIRLVKWEELQSDDRQMTEDVTDEGQANDRQLTTTKEYKEYKDLEEYILLSKTKKDLFDDWLDYRIKIKKTIKNIKTIKSLINEFHKFSEEEIAVAISKSINNQWQGLFLDKISLNQEKQKINRQTIETIKSNVEGWFPPKM